MSLHKSDTAGEAAARSAPAYSAYDAVHSEFTLASRTPEILQRTAGHHLVRRTPEAPSRDKSIATSPADAPKPLHIRISGTGTRKRNFNEGSLLPRSVSKSYNDRPESLSSSGPPPPLPAPSSGSRIPVSSSFSKGTALGPDSTRRTLRRRAPSVEQHVSSLDRSRPHSKPHIESKNDPPARRHSKSFPTEFRDAQPTSTFSVAPSEMIAPTTMLPIPRPGELPSALIPELKTLAAANISPHAASSTPPVPSVSSPSTRYSGSTGPWSSRDTTPTSISSCSPGLVQPSRTKATSGLRKELPPRYDTLESLKTSRMAQPASGPLSSFSPRNPSKNDKREQNSLPHRGEKQNKRTVTPPASMLPPRKTSVRSKSSQEVGEASDHGPTDTWPEHKAKARSIGGGPLKESISTLAISSKHPSPREIPRRPSRTGTAGLDSKSSPAVRSNLSRQSLQGYQGRDFLDVSQSRQTPHALVSAGVTNADPQNEQLIQAEDLHRPVPQQVRRGPGSTRLPVKRPLQGTTKPILSPNERNDQESHGSRRSTISRLSSRLAIFSRRPKVSHEDTSPKENRDLRKGPAAGTGHEGYGKYARRGRKHSVGSVNSSRERSTSTISRPSLRRKHSAGSTGGSDYDEFVAQRLQPIIIPGGGSQNVGPDSNAQKVWPPVWPDLPRASSESELSLHLAKQPTRDEPGLLVSDAISMSASSMATDAPSLVATDVIPNFVSKAISNQKKPGYAPPSLDGYSTSQSSLMQDEAPSVVPDDQLGRPYLGDLKTASKAGKRFKWNFFRRKTSPKKANVGFDEHAAGSVHVPVAVSSVSVHKPIPYYALLDSENEDEGENGLRNILDQVHEPPSPVAEVSSEPHGLGLRRQYGQSVLLPSMPTMHEEVSSPASLRSPLLASGYDPQPNRPPNPNPRQSPENQRHRLPQVGRIPRVISRRDRQHRPAMTSFSRPFQFENLGDAPNGSGNYTASTAETRRPILGIRTDVLPSRPFSTPESGQAVSAPAGPLNIRPLGDFESQSENVVFPGRDLSMEFQSSSPKRIISTTKVWPSAGHHHTEEDEIWNEYDDLLDNVLTPSSPDLALSTPRFSPASYYLGGETRRESVLRQETLQRSWEDMHAIQVPSPRLSLPHPSPGDIASALYSKPSVPPSSPFSISDYNSMGYADQRLGGTDVRQHIKGANAVEPGLLSPSASPGYWEFPKVTEVSHHHSTALLDVVERDRDGPAGHSDLRFAALMTSRWLSFGRVLFSPAHEVVEANPGRQILVIDGLGNDDWAFYCAINYPEAFVYGLKETDGAAESRREASPDSWREPSNYRRVELPNLAERFPFPQSFFAAVVFRFPVAMSDNILKMALAECKRVLVPGGHIELSLLDLDIFNMGTITRHAIRELKSRMITADPEVSLKPVSDNIQNMLGLKGFENLNRCLVSVPVTGKVATSSGSRSSRSSRDSINHKGKEADGTSGASGASVRQNRGSNDTDRYPKRGGNFSLNELVLDHSATSDEKIAKMVAKVGRWWYTRTYELIVLPGGDSKRSIWSDKKMLHECKVRGSGFRLLIAYAQKPTEMRRRTLSEPVRPTTAVAGTGMMIQFDEEYPQGETHQFLPPGR